MTSFSRLLLTKSDSFVREIVPSLFLEMSETERAVLAEFSLRRAADIGTLSYVQQRKLYERLQKELEWETKEEKLVKEEKSRLFGKPPYPFLGAEHRPDRDKWLDGTPRQRRTVGDPDYRSARPGPNYSKFVPTMRDERGRDYRAERLPDEPFRLFCKRSVSVLAEAKEDGDEREAIVQQGEKLTLHHLRRRKPPRGWYCPGHEVIVNFVQQYPRAATFALEIEDTPVRDREREIASCYEE